MEPSEDRRLDRAARVGSRVALGIAVIGGSVLTGSAWYVLAGKPEIALSVGACTVIVAAFARLAGRIAGRRIEGRGLWASLGIGALGGLATLLVAAMAAEGVGAGWGKPGKVFLGVLGYGAGIAGLLGVLGGGVIYGWLRRGAHSSTESS